MLKRGCPTYAPECTLCQVNARNWAFINKHLAHCNSYSTYPAKVYGTPSWFNIVISIYIERSKNKREILKRSMDTSMILKF